MDTFKKHLLNFFSITVIFIIDRISKFLVIRFADINGDMNINITSFLNLNLIWNDGIAFGLLSFDEKSSYNLISIIIFIVILTLIIILKNTQKLSRLAFIMIIGGALGNFIDRIYFSAVPDFIDFYYRDFHWFVFNVADIFITLGVICLIYDEVFMEKSKK